MGKCILKGYRGDLIGRRWLETYSSWFNPLHAPTAAWARGSITWWIRARQQIRGEHRPLSLSKIGYIAPLDLTLTHHLDAVLYVALRSLLTNPFMW